MSDLQSLLKKLNASPVSTQSYVYYIKDTGKIHKISSTNIPEKDFAVFEIDNELVKPILIGERRTDEFTITYDVSLKQLRLKEAGYQDNHKTACTMNYQLPVIKSTHESHFLLTSVYEGLTVYIWDITKDYRQGECVWVNSNVYKLTTDIESGNKFNVANHTLFVIDVHLTSVPTQEHSIEKLSMVKEYKGIHVDIWYKDLSHLSGQHVWFDNTVYKLLEDTVAGTEFIISKAEVIVENVNLYSDKNKSLTFTTDILIGDVILNNNSIYSIQNVLQNFGKDKTSVFFYNSSSTMLYYNNPNCLEVNLDTVNEEISTSNAVLDLTNITDLKNGQTLLCGKQLYQIKVDKEYDIIVQQNTVNKTWSIMLNPYTKKFLQTSGAMQDDVLFFSITSKYDPNILYTSLEFKISDLLSESTSVIPIVSEYEQDPDNVSIYTAKYFDSYAHEVI